MSGSIENERHLMGHGVFSNALISDDYNISVYIFDLLPSPPCSAKRVNKPKNEKYKVLRVTIQRGDNSFPISIPSFKST